MTNEEFITYVTERPLFVVRSAIRCTFGGLDVFVSLPRPKRHHHIIQHVRDGGYEGPVDGDRQGFILSNGQFCIRKAAKRIALKAGQIKGKKTISHVLTSEDLW